MSSIAIKTKDNQAIDFAELQRMSIVELVKADNPQLLLSYIERLQHELLIKTIEAKVAAHRMDYLRAESCALSIAKDRLRSLAADKSPHICIHRSAAKSISLTVTASTHDPQDNAHIARLLIESGFHLQDEEEDDSVLLWLTPDEARTVSEAGVDLTPLLLAPIKKGTLIKEEVAEETKEQLSTTSMTNN